MKKLDKSIGLVGLIAINTVSTVVSQWMTDREIAEKVIEAVTKRK